MSLYPTRWELLVVFLAVLMLALIIMTFAQ